MAQTAVKNESTDFRKLQWLLGEWDRTNLKAGRSGMEKWIQGSDVQMEGWGITLKGADTIAREKFKLVQKGQEIFYVADVPENKAPVYFKLTLIKDDEFICENPEHDFPKKIAYKRKGDQMLATISGDGKSIDFYFQRKK
jgi:hypothetical protein